MTCPNVAIVATTFVEVCVAVNTRQSVRAYGAGVEQHASLLGRPAHRHLCGQCSCAENDTAKGSEADRHELRDPGYLKALIQSHES